MHLRFLKTFCDIVDLGSFSRAAKANGVSQSNASQIVHHLEEHLGVQLIDRSKRPFLVTPEGKRFHEGARVIVQRYDDLEREVRSLHEATAARLTVASIYSVGLAHMSGSAAPVPRGPSAGRCAIRIFAPASCLRSGGSRTGRPGPGELSRRVGQPGDHSLAHGADRARVLSAASAREAAQRQL